MCILPMKRAIKYGWKPELPDHRDRTYTLPGLLRFIARFYFITKHFLPKKVDLRSKVTKVFDQGNLGSCVGNAFATVHQFIRKMLGKSTWDSSRLFIYYNARLLENSVNEDSGAYIRDGAKAIAKWGVAPENEWPYNIREFTKKPTDVVYASAEKNQELVYERFGTPTITAMKHALSKGYPFVFGFTVYESFYSNAVEKTGQMPMPGKGEKPQGGHAVMAVGYDEDKKVFIILNSWGEKWGDKGYFYMPYEFIDDDNYCDDFWVLKTTE